MGTPASLYLCTGKCCEFEIGAAQIRIGKIGAAQARAPKDRAGEVSAPKIGTIRSGICEVRLSLVSAKHVGASQSDSLCIHSVQEDVSEVDAIPFGIDQICTCQCAARQISVVQYCLAEVGAEQLGALHVCFTKVSAMKTDCHHARS